MIQLLNYPIYFRIILTTEYERDLQGMPPLKFLGHTNYLHKWSNYDSITQLPYLL